jgi:hypothetical protein
LLLDQMHEQTEPRFVDFYQKESSTRLEKDLSNILELAKKNKINVVGVGFAITKQMKTFDTPGNILRPNLILKIIS